MPEDNPFTDEVLRKLIEQLPEDATVDDLTSRIVQYFLTAVSQSTIEEGHAMPQEAGRQVTRYILDALQRGLTMFVEIKLGEKRDAGYQEVRQLIEKKNGFGPNL